MAEQASVATAPQFSDFQRLNELKIELIRRNVLGEQIEGTMYRRTIPSLSMAVQIMARDVMGLTLTPGHLMGIDHLSSGLRRTLFAYRGFGKSWTFTVPRGLVQLVRNVEERILVASRTETMAGGFVLMMKNHMQDNTMFRLCFGDLLGKASLMQFTIRTRKGNWLEPSVRAVGVGGSVVSRHYTTHLLDDIVDDKNTSTEGRRAGMMMWYDLALKPTLEPEGVEHVVGTRYHPRDLYTRIIEEQEIEEADIEPDEKLRMDTSMALPALSEDWWGKERVPWSERHSLKWMELKQKTTHPIVWAGQYMQNVNLMVGKIVEEKWIDQFQLGTEPVPKFVLATADLCASGKDVDRNSYFATLRGLVDEHGHLWVTHQFRARLQFDDQVKKVVEWNTEFKPAWYGLESVAAQAWMPQHLLSTYGLTNIIAMPPVGDKVLRCTLHTATLAKQGRLHIAKNLYETLEEVLLFPDGDHDDLVDALSMMVELAASVGGRMGGKSDLGMASSSDGKTESILDEEF